MLSRSWQCSAVLVCMCFSTWTEFCSCQLVSESKSVLCKNLLLGGFWLWSVKFAFCLLTVPKDKITWITDSLYLHTYYWHIDLRKSHFSYWLMIVFLNKHLKLFLVFCFLCLLSLISYWGDRIFVQRHGEEVYQMFKLSIRSRSSFSGKKQKF